jgi:hypothetical protein
MKTPIRCDDPTDFDFDDDEDAECPNCFGEGVIYDCVDGFCVDWLDGCSLCARSCDWCRPAPKTKAPDADPR